MKKNFLWMIAAILLCGTLTTVFTACGSSSDDDTPSTSANTYEVTLAAILPRVSAPYLQLQLKYVDADGKTETVVVKEGDQSQTMNDATMILYKSLTNTYRLSPEYIQLLDDVIVRNVKLRVPAGKSFSFVGTIVSRTDFEKPSGKVTIIQPCVISTGKRISGNSEDRSELATNGTLNIIGNFGISADNLMTLVSRWNGRDVSSGNVTMR